MKSVRDDINVSIIGPVSFSVEYHIQREVDWTVNAATESPIIHRIKDCTLSKIENHTTRHISRALNEYS